MRTLKLALAGAVGSLALAGAAQAQEAPGIDLSFNIGASTEYVFRGVSQTDEDPQVFGGVDATIGSIGYAGVWVSNVDFLDSTDFEFDIYGGVKPVVGAVTLDIGFVYYGYADQPTGADYDYWEAKFGASIPAGPATVGVVAYYSPDFFGPVDEALYYEANAAVSIPNSKFSISGAVGHQWVEGPGDYTTWNLGVGFALTDHVGFDVRYHDTDEHNFGDIFEERVVGSIKLIF